MPTLDVHNMQNEKVGSIDLNDAVFGAEVKEHLFYTVVRQQLANRRQGSHKVKSRTEVSGGGKKPFKQKGTGRARAGTTRAVHWRGGGVVHGPVVRDHGHKVNKKVRRAALRSALSRRVEEQAFTVFDSFELPEIKTKAVRTVVNAFGFDDMLLIVAQDDETLARSARNLQNVKVLPVAGLNVYDILLHKNVAATQAAVDGITARLGS